MKEKKEVVKNQYRHLDNNALIEIAKKYKTRVEFFKSDMGAYKTACRRGIFEDVCSHMARRKTGPYISDKEILKKAKSYNSLTVLIKENRKLYTILQKRFGKEVFDKLDIRENRNFTDQELQDLIKKYPKKSDFRKADASAYQICLKRGLIQKKEKNVQKDKQTKTV